MRIACWLLCLWLFLGGGSAVASELDDYYLSRFGGLSAAQLTALVQVQNSGNLPIEHCGTPLVRGLRQDWPRLQAATQIVLAKQLAAPVLDSAYQSGHFTIHYSTAGPHSFLPPRGYSTVIAWVQEVGNVFEEVYAKEVGQLLYKDPIPNGQRINIYLQNVGSQYLGITDSSSPATQPYITIENDFSEFPTYDPTDLLQITAAHEFHHVIQFAYTFWFDMWYAEATATWIEDEVYDGVNQLYAYVAPYYRSPGYSLNAPVSTYTGGGYGRWLFNRQIAERFGIAKVRQIWEAIDGAGNGADISILSYMDKRLQTAGSSLASTFEGFAIQMYLKEWSTHTNDLNRIPPLLMTDYTTYPVNAQSALFPGGSLQPYSFAAFSFTAPLGAQPRDFILSFSNRTPGIRLVLFQTLTSGVIQQLAVDQAATSLKVPSFYGGGISKVVLLAINTANIAGTISFSTDGSAVTSGVIPAAGGANGGAEIVSPAYVTSTSTSKSACFIATAAYGSYLHPKVQVLRNFRDCYLLNNRFGQAFVAWYYGWSPGAARIIAGEPKLRLICRCLLTPFILAVEYPLGALSGLLVSVALVGYWRRRRCIHQV